ncbi:MAG: ArsC family reductase [Rhizomicrobium sp.]|jgi:arsenate reductase
MHATIFGIPNCDTMKKARDWLDRHHIAYRFHDYRKDGVPEALLAGWVTELGWEALLNRKGTTFRKLPESARAGLNAHRALALMCAQPSLIRRPVLDTGQRRVVGFAPQVYATLF